MYKKYSNINIDFVIGTVKFTVLNIVCERFLRSIPMHAHSDNSYEIHYIEDGHGTATVNGEKYTLSPKTLYITGPNISHEHTPLLSDPIVEYCIYLKAESIKGIPPEKDSMEDIFTKNHFWFGFDSQNLSETVSQLLNELDGKRPGFAVAARGLLEQCVVKIVRNYIFENRKLSFSKYTVKSKPENLNEQKYIILEECFLYEYENITLKKLSDRLGLGTRQTERLLKAHYGKTFLQKKTEAKMSAAAVMLAESSKSITDISSALGYSTSEHFSQSFKKYYGMSPRDFRNKAIK